MRPLPTRLPSAHALPRRDVLRWALVAWPAATGLPLRAQPRTGRRVAYVVGNARYSSEPPLANPHADARLMARVLKDTLKFDEVIERRDLSRHELYDLVTEVGRQARGADAVVVYFSGHGMRGPGGNYLIPVDARISEEDHVRRDGVPAADLVDVLQASGARVALLVLDACRDSPYTRRTRSTSKGLARMNVSGGNLLVAYATSDGQTADDGAAGNSPYARALAQHLGDSSRSVLAQFDAVRRTTRDLTGNRQNPTREGDLEVDVYLLPPGIGNAGTGTGRTPDTQVALAPATQPAPPPAFNPPATAPAQPAAQATGPAGDAGTLVVRIGHVGPVTGSLARLGRDNEWGAQLAVEDINAQGLRVGGRSVRLELVTADDAADPKTATEAAARLVAQGVLAVVGHLNSGTSIPASAIYAQAGVAQISPSATNPRYTQLGHRTAFRLVANDQQMGHALGHHAVTTLKARRVVVVDDRTAYGQGIADAFEQGVRAAGGQVLQREFTSDRATDFVAILSALKAQQPDLLFLGGMDTTARALLLQMRQMGMQARLMGGDGICSSRLAEVADGRVLCAEAGGVELPSLRLSEFNARFKARFSTDVQLYAPYCYDAVQVLADALVRGGGATRQQLLAALPGTQITGLTGPIRFARSGDPAQGTLSLYTYQSGRRESAGLIRAAGG